MKTARKVLVLALCAVLLVSATIMGTMAYLTSTKTVTNTFTVGNVAIKLDETDITKADGSRTEVGNAYHLLPGGTYVKDPTVTVLQKSEKSYVRIVVTVTGIAGLKEAYPQFCDANGVFLLENLVTGWDRNTWQCVSATANGVYEFRYKDIVDASAAEQKLPALFTNVVVPQDTDNTQLAKLNNAEIKIVANAIQAEGFANADAAWNAFK